MTAAGLVCVLVMGIAAVTADTRYRDQTAVVGVIAAAALVAVDGWLVAIVAGTITSSVWAIWRRLATDPEPQRTHQWTEDQL